MAEGEAIDPRDPRNDDEHDLYSEGGGSGAGDAGDSGGQIDSRLIALREVLVKAGLIVDLQREVGDWFIVCAAQRGPDGLYGNSIRLAFRDQRLLISTLTDQSYVIPDGVNLAQLCRDCVNASESMMDRLPDDVVKHHRLEVVADA